MMSMIESCFKLDDNYGEGEWELIMGGDFTFEPQQSEDLLEDYVEEGSELEISFID